MLFYLLILSCQLSSEKEPVLEDTDLDGFFSDEDCDDENALIHPQAQEVCNGIDDDCDYLVDDGDDSVDLLTGFVSYLDTDGDGFGAEEIYVCVLRIGVVENSEDCDDENASIHPQVEEVCNGVDDNCDGIIDTDAIDRLERYRDLDGDTFGNKDDVQLSCTLPEGFVDDSSDCNDLDPQIYPQAIEICNFLDDNCDSLVDDLDPFVDWSTGTWFYQDVDGDGFGAPETDLQRCVLPTGYSETDDDCNDSDAAVHPLAVEVCDEIDNDCSLDTAEEGLISVSIVGADLVNVSLGQVYSVAQEQSLFFCAGTHYVSIVSDADLSITGLGEVILKPLLDDIVAQTGGVVSMENLLMEGGIQVSGGFATLTNVSISNVAQTAVRVLGGVMEGNTLHIISSNGALGGAIFVEDGTLTLNDSVLEGNEAGEGGAIYALESTLSLVDTRIENNTASLGGGAQLVASDLTCVGQANTSYGFFSNTQYGISVDEASSVIATNCDVQDNLPEDIQAPEYTYFAAEDGNYTCGQGMCGSSVAHSVSGLLVDNYSNNNAFRGNIYDVVGNPTLDSFDIGLEFSYCDIVLSVFTRSDPTQEWMLLFEEAHQESGSNSWVSSDAVGIPLFDGEQVLIGAGWVCDSAPDYSSYTVSSAGYGVGTWSGSRVVHTNFSGVVQPTELVELSSSYLYEQRLYVTSLY